MSLLQPQRETYNLFDDVMLLAEGATLFLAETLSTCAQHPQIHLQKVQHSCQPANSLSLLSYTSTSAILGSAYIICTGGSAYIPHIS
jgi:hypothetical protein